MPDITLVLGGARSGKSRFALELAGKVEGNKVFLATAQPLDQEMARRIEKHQKARGPDWITLEEPLDLIGALKKAKPLAKVVVLDCLTLWLGNLMTHLGEEEALIQERITQFLAFLPDYSLPLILVSNEVGLGIVPEAPVARLFRDIAGFLHQELAKIAQKVYFLTAGLPVKIK
jgi:adenosylcobinamide kinase/adenosylcobinamide-phosphate guanylyltransferase